MNDSEKEIATVSNKKKPLNWPARIFFSLFSATGIGLALGLLMSIDAKGVDGESGYAALLYIPVMIFFTFLALIFVTNKRAHIVFSIISALIWAIALISGVIS